MNGNHVMLIGIAVCLLPILLYYPVRFAWFRVATAYMRAMGDYYREATYRVLQKNAAQQDELADALEEEIRLLRELNQKLTEASTQERGRISKNISEMDPRQWFSLVNAREEIAKAVRERTV